MYHLRLNTRATGGRGARPPDSTNLKIDAMSVSCRKESGIQYVIVKRKGAKCNNRQINTLIERRALVTLLQVLLRVVEGLVKGLAPRGLRDELLRREGCARRGRRRRAIEHRRRRRREGMQRTFPGTYLRADLST
eukprot:scaffold449_cov59-Phaeocystis_antarctica.AAC.1